MRGHELLRIHHSPDGTRICGTHNNCSSGFILWGTCFTCEENWVGYFSTQDSEPPREPTRYGVRNISRLGWETLASDELECFNATCKGKQVQDDYRNEPNSFG